MRTRLSISLVKELNNTIENNHLNIQVFLLEREALSLPYVEPWKPHT